jgi:hypothetical protein
MLLFQEVDVLFVQLVLKDLLTEQLVKFVLLEQQEHINQLVFGVHLLRLQHFLEQHYVRHVLREQ